MARATTNAINHHHSADNPETASDTISSKPILSNCAFPRSDARSRPLAGLRVADLTRVIAGPICGRTLAAHGADVLRIHPPHLPEMPALAMDGGRGKRCADVDLRDAGDRRAFDALIEGADVFVQGFRPGGLASLGCAPEAVAERRPGIVYVTLSAWGESGPWAERHGFDSLVQTATGIVAEGSAAKDAGEPVPLPCQALDHRSGYLAAFGAMAGLARRATEGGSWLVRVSLAGTGRWFDGLGRIRRMGRGGAQGVRGRLDERRPVDRLEQVVGRNPSTTVSFSRVESRTAPSRSRRRGRKPALTRLRQLGEDSVDFHFFPRPK